MQIVIEIPNNMDLRNYDIPYDILKIITDGTPLDEIITQIEQARDKDKNCGEYPYNRCIDIIKEEIKNED